MPYLNTFERHGIEQGLLQGREEGREEGRQQERETLARNLIAMNLLTEAQIAKASGLSEAEVARIRAENPH